MYDSEIASLKYPKDAVRIGRLNVTLFQAWYASQDAREMVYLGQFKEFQRFVFLHYTWKVKLLRLYYKLKGILSGKI